MIILWLLGFLAYGFLLFFLAPHSIWYSVGIYAIVMLVLFLMFYFSVGYKGGSDAAGNGMERAFLNLFYFGAMGLSSLIFLACLIRWYIKYY